MTNNEEVERRLGDAVAGALQTNGEFLTKFVLLAETVDAEGNRGVWTATSDGMTAWDSIGLLQFALYREQQALNTMEE